MLKRRALAAFPIGRGEHTSTIIFATMIVVLLLATGTALDYARLVNMRKGIEQAVDSASRAGMDALSGGNLMNGEIKTIALSHFDKDAMIVRHVGTIDGPLVRINRERGTVMVEATGTVAMTTSRLFGVKEIAVPVIATASGAPTAPLETTK